MQRSLLYIVQRVLDKLDFNQVNTLSGNTEALQIAYEAETTFYDLISREDWAFTSDRIEILGSGVVETPMILSLQEEAIRIDDIYYDVTIPPPVIPDPLATEHPITWKTMKYLKPDDFVAMTFRRNNIDSSVELIPYNSVEFLIVTDADPTWWTTFDNKTLVFDAYDKEKDTTLQGSKTNVMGMTLPSWKMIDTFEIPIPVQLFPTYLAQVTAACSAYYKQELSSIDEKRGFRGLSRMRRKANTAAGFPTRNNYGRRNSGQETTSVQRAESSPY